MPRKVRLIYIDDENRPQDHIAKRFELSTIKTVEDTQKHFLNYNYAPDIIVCDVNMQANNHNFEGTKFELHSKIAPYGPMLAVPLISDNPLTTFVPYSASWKKDKLGDNGYFLITLSFIFARSSNRRKSISQTRKEMDNLEGYTSLPGAVRAGLEFLRCKLHDPDRYNIILVDIRQSLEDLESVIAYALEEGEDRVELSKVGSDEDIGIGFLMKIPGADRLERISLSSLYADILNYKSAGSVDQIKKIREDVSLLLPKSTELLKFQTDMLEDCEEVIQFLHQIQAKDSIPQTKKKGIKTPFIQITNKISVRRGHSKYRLRRYVILFAWVIAWYKRKEHWGPREISRTVYDVLALDSTAHRQYKMLLHGSDTKNESYNQRRPFVQYEESPYGVRAFKLDQSDVKSNLTAVERYMCRLYAKQILEWEHNADNYPHWMLRD